MGIAIGYPPHNRGKEQTNKSQHIAGFALSIHYINQYYVFSHNVMLYPMLGIARNRPRKEHPPILWPNPVGLRPLIPLFVTLSPKRPYSVALATPNKNPRPTLPPP